MKFRKFFLAVFLIFFSLSSCKENNNEEDEFVEEPIDTSEMTSQEQDNDLINTIAGNPELSNFAGGLDNNSELIQKGAPMTVFAPNNTAMSYYHQKQGTDVLGVDDNAVIQYHVVPELIDMENLRSRIGSSNDSLRLKTLHGEELIATIENNEIHLHGNSGGKAKLIESMTATNGVVHIVSEVLIPREIDRKNEIIQQ